jgi:hypothetical protein
VQLEDWASKNLKDRYFSLIDRLVEEEIADECTVPFVPYVGANYCDAKPKILIIGKATYGWGKGDGGQQGSGTLHDVLDKDDHDRWKYLVELPEEFIEGEIIPYYGGAPGHYYNGPFWRRIYQLSGKLLMGHPVADYKPELRRSEECFWSIAWSNVFKVGALKSEGGNPKKKLRDIQKEVNKKEGNAFEEEITALQPDVAIFSTGPDYDKHIKALLPNTSMKDVGPKHEHLKIKEIEGLDTLAFRTYHFQASYYSNEIFEQVVDYICDRMNEKVTEG